MSKIVYCASHQLNCKPTICLWLLFFSWASLGRRSSRITSAQKRSGQQKKKKHKQKKKKKMSFPVKGGSFPVGGIPTMTRWQNWTLMATIQIKSQWKCFCLFCSTFIMCVKGVVFCRMNVFARIRFNFDVLEAL